MELHEQIRFIRRAKKLKTWQLSARVGISSSYLSSIESGNKKPSIDVLMKIAKELNVKINLCLNA